MSVATPLPAGFRYDAWHSLTIWIAEGTLTATVRNYQQAGLIAYASDDDFARLSHVAIWNTRQIEYGRELPFAGRLSFGGIPLTAPADTTWLRLSHTTDRTTGEHRFRAASSRDGHQ